MTFTAVTMKLLEGFGQNLLLFVLTLLLSIPLGLVICLGSMTNFKPVRWLSRTIVWIIRGTPLMLQLYVVMYVPGLVFHFPIRSRMTAALIAFVINYACYFSEIYRGGIESITRGQYEAGQVLGLSKVQTFFHVILLQVIKRIVPPMSNEIITLVKDTSLSRIIALPEIVMQSTEYSAVGIIWPLFYTGAFFLVFSALLTFIFNRVEKKLDYFRS